MSYATKEELIARFGETELIQLTDRKKLGGVDDAVLGPALSDADAEAESYLVGRYTLPLDPVPAALVANVCDLARFRLYGIRAPDAVRTRYEDARAWLRDVAAGKVLLSRPTPSAEVPSHEVRVCAPRPVFTDSLFERRVRP